MLKKNHQLSPELAKGFSEAKAQLTAIIEHTPMALNLKTPDGVYVYVNKLYETWFGVKREDIVGKTARDIMSKELASEIEAFEINVLRDHKVCSFERMTIRNDNDTFYRRVSKFPVFDPSGTLIGLGTASADITKDIKNQEALASHRDQLEELVAERTLHLEQEIAERKRVEKEIEAHSRELEKINHQKDKMFSIIAHDLKNPFNAIFGYSSLLSSIDTSNNPEKIEEYSNAIHASAKHVYGLLENLLDWSTLHTGTLEFEPSHLNLKTIVDENLDLFLLTAEEKRIHLRSDIKTSVSVHADAYMLNTVIRNLVSNALKFTPGNGSVVISSHVKENYVEIKITDSGVGISEDKRSRLFKLNEKISTKGTNGEMGTGLGLQLCKDLIEKQGGQLSVESVIAEGSTFLFTLPTS